MLRAWAALAHRRARARAKAWAVRQVVHRRRLLSSWVAWKAVMLANEYSTVRTGRWVLRRWKVRSVVVVVMVW